MLLAIVLANRIGFVRLGNGFESHFQVCYMLYYRLSFYTTIISSRSQLNLSDSAR